MYKVLIAEDETIERKVLCKILRKHLGDLCTFIEVKNGTEAWAAYQQEQPEIALLDIQMPGMTGLEVAGKIRHEGPYCSIVFLSAYDYFSYARQAIAYHAVDYILKPYGEEELVSSVEEAIRIYDWYASQPGRRKTSAPRAEEARETDSRTGLVRQEIESYIRAHYSEDLSMQDMARVMNYSDAYFCKLFKQCFKVNFSTYLNEFRVARAKELLANTADSIREIGTGCGYTDSNYFTRVFRRITGMTPSEYRQSLTK